MSFNALPASFASRLTSNQTKIIPLYSLLRCREESRTGLWELPSPLLILLRIVVKSHSASVDLVMIIITFFSTSHLRRPYEDAHPFLCSPPLTS